MHRSWFGADNEGNRDGGDRYVGQENAKPINPEKEPIPPPIIPETTAPSDNHSDIKDSNPVSANSAKSNHSVMNTALPQEPTQNHSNTLPNMEQAVDFPVEIQSDFVDRMVIDFEVDAPLQPKRKP